MRCSNGISLISTVLTIVAIILLTVGVIISGSSSEEIIEPTEQIYCPTCGKKL